jgi:hypothetical protein
MTKDKDGPPATMGDFDRPPSAVMAYTNRKEVSWTATTSQKSAKTTEIRLFPVKYQVTSHLSMINVLKMTMTMFLGTDPAFYMVSRVNDQVIIKTADDFDKYSHQQLQELSPQK